jgi:hypothetical protein
VKRRNLNPAEADVGVVEEPTHFRSEEGHGSRGSRGYGPCFSSRRRGDGTRGRSADPKQGRCRPRPRPSRRARTPCITNELGKSGGAVETGGSGRSSVDGGDNITSSERRARGSRWSLLSEPEAGWVPERASRIRRRDISDEGHVKPRRRRGYVDLALYLGGSAGRAWLTETRLGLEPYWGNPAVRFLARIMREP